MPRDTGTKRTSTGKVEIDSSTETAEVVGGGIKIGDSSDTTAGVVRYSPGTNKLQYYNGTTWVDCAAPIGGGGGYDEFAAGPTDTFTHVFAGMEVMANYTAFASDTTEVFGFDTEAQP